MKVRELRDALTEIRDVFTAAGTKRPEQDLCEILSLLDGFEDDDLNGFLKSLANELEGRQHVPKPAVATLNELLVSRYFQRLQAADIDRKMFDEVYLDLKSDSDMRKAEVELLAKKYLARKENSKTRQLEAIETRFREFRYDRKANERAGAVSPW